MNKKQKSLSNICKLEKYALIYKCLISITNTNMLKHIKTDAKSNRQFIAERGHMLSFLLGAFAAALWIHVFQEPMNENITAYLMSTLG